MPTLSPLSLTCCQVGTFDSINEPHRRKPLPFGVVKYWLLSVSLAETQNQHREGWGSQEQSFSIAKRTCCKYSISWTPKKWMHLAVWLCKVQWVTLQLKATKHSCLLTGFCALCELLQQQKTKQEKILFFLFFFVTTFGKTWLMAGSDQKQQEGLKALRAREEGWMSASVHHSDSPPLRERCASSLQPLHKSQLAVLTYLYTHTYSQHIYYVNTSAYECIHHCTHTYTPFSSATNHYFQCL